MTQAPTVNLEKHSLFKKKSSISTKEDIILERLEKFGEKIIVDIPLPAIEIRPQVRKTFDEEKIKDLSEDIKKKGLIHPVTLMKKQNISSEYILLIGGNRLEAFKQLGRHKIPAIIKPYTDNEVHIQLIQLAENMHRTDINPIELADAIMKIKTISTMTLEQLSKAVGRNINSLKQYSRLSKMDAEEKAFHIQNKSTKNQILKYLATRDKAPKKKNTSSPILLLEKITITKSGTHKDNKRDILKKIKQAEAFIEEAKKMIH